MVVVAASAHALAAATMDDRVAVWTPAASFEHADAGAADVKAQSQNQAPYVVLAQSEAAVVSFRITDVALQRDYGKAALCTCTPTCCLLLPLLLLQGKKRNGNGNSRNSSKSRCGRRGALKGAQGRLQ